MDGAGQTILRLKAENQELRDELERTTKALAIREETVRRLRRDLATKDMEIARLQRTVQQYGNHRWDCCIDEQARSYRIIDRDAQCNCGWTQVRAGDQNS